MVYKVILAGVSRLACSAIMIWMAVPKISDPNWLLGLSVQWLPSSLAWFLGNILPWAEISLGMLLLSPVLWRPAARLLGLLLGAFIPVLIMFAIEGRVDCGCGGSGSLFPSWMNSPYAGLARNSTMIVILWLTIRSPCVSINKINKIGK